MSARDHFIRESWLKRDISVLERDIENLEERHNNFLLKLKAKLKNDNVNKALKMIKKELKRA